MTRVVFRKACPNCKGLKLRRIERKPWMRYLPKSKHYRCSFCRGYCFVLYDRVSLKLG